MTADYVYALEFLRDGRELATVRVKPDFSTAVEAVRFAALRAGLPPGVALRTQARIEPRWHPSLGQPYASALVASALAPDRHAIAIDVPVRFFADSARGAIDSLVDRGLVESGESVTFLVTAYPVTGDEAAASEQAVVTEELDASLEISDRALDERRLASPHGQVVAGDAPVLIPRPVVDEIRAMTSMAEGLETGGFLIGHVCRDTRSGDLFLEVSDWLPARHTRATISTLTFTPETWWEARAALALRNRGETWLGWVHSHPVSALCRRRGCSIEAQRACPMARDFFSDHDRFLHRTMFPRGHAIALVVNDWEFAPPTLSLFGYRAGLIDVRGFHLVGDQ
jgi:hypothetical protein